MKQSLLSFLLVLAIEAMSAVIRYLNNKLVHQTHRNPSHDSEPEFA